MKNLFKVIIMVIPTLLNAERLDLERLYNEFPDYVLTPVNLMEMKHAFVVEEMKNIQSLTDQIKLEQVGKSAEGRSINMLSFGRGKTKLLLWSQMHGDEATASAGLLSVFYYLAKNIDQPYVKSLNDNLSIHAIIMLNPDGSENYQRRNTQGIDINRDAQRLATPEGKILKRMHEQIQPDYAFNLHDMRGKETVGESGKLLTKALMAPPYNKENEDSQTRVRAKKLVVIIKNALDTYIAGHVARYKADYMPRAFGDAFQNWGVSTVLIESGIPNLPAPHHLTRLSFLSLFAAFDAISEGYVMDIDPLEYEQIPLEGIQLFDMIIENALIYNGKNQIPFRGDIGINVSREWKENKTVLTGIIEDIGDLSITSGRTIIKDDNLIVTPGFIMVSDDPSEAATKKGITTQIKSNHSAANDLAGYPKEKQINPKMIYSLTGEPAKKLGLKNKGIIDIDKSADLLIFRSQNSEKLYLNELFYVIKNGQIVYRRTTD